MQHHPVPICRRPERGSKSGHGRGVSRQVAHWALYCNKAHKHATPPQMQRVTRRYEAPCGSVAGCSHPSWAISAAPVCPEPVRGLAVAKCTGFQLCSCAFCRLGASCLYEHHVYVAIINVQTVSLPLRRLISEHFQYSPPNQRGPPDQLEQLLRRTGGLHDASRDKYSPTRATTSMKTRL